MQADSQKVTHLLKTARGQIERVLQMVEEDTYCIAISNQLLAIEALLRSANRQVLHAHLEGCVLDAAKNGNPEEKIQEIKDIVDKLSR